MKPAYIALAALLLWPGATIAQDAPAPQSETESTVEPGDDAADAGEAANDAPRPGPVQKSAPF